MQTAVRCFKIFLLLWLCGAGVYVSPLPPPGASVTVSCYVSDNHSPVINYLAKLKNAANQIIAVDTARASNTVVFHNVPTPVEHSAEDNPKTFFVNCNYPNPFNPSTVITYGIPRAAFVTARIYDVRGQTVKTFINAALEAGAYQAVWAGDNDEGKTAAAGVYIFALSTDNFRKAIKMINLGGSGQSVHRRMASSVASAATAYALNYTIELSPYDATRPYFAVKTIPITVSGDTAFAVDLERILKSPQVSALSDVNVKEDIMPQDHHLVDMWGKAIGYDSSANPVDPSQLAFAVDNISPQGKAYFSIQDNRYITLDSLAHDANGTVIANVKTTAPNGKSTTVPLKLVIAPMTDLSGGLVDFENNPRQGYVLAISKNNDSSLVQTDALGNFSLQYNETDGDSIKAHIKPTQGHNEAFVRILYLPGRGDKSGITLDAIPALDDSVYIGLDTLNRFAMEANFGAMSFEGLKKANFDSLKEVITSRNTFWTSGDTLHPDEQQYIMNLLKTKMDTHFKKKPTYIVIPQDSTMTSFNKNDAINWFKQKNLSTPGAITCLDPDYDGIINYSVISLLNVKDIMGQDTIYNDKAILQEGLSGRVAPGEVGIISPIRSNQTILHKNTQCNSLMPADDWLIKIAEHYAPKTSYYVLLKTDNFERIKNYSVP